MKKKPEHEMNTKQMFEDLIQYGLENDEKRREIVSSAVKLITHLGRKMPEEEMNQIVGGLKTFILPNNK